MKQKGGTKKSAASRAVTRDEVSDLITSLLDGLNETDARIDALLHVLLRNKSISEDEYRHELTAMRAKIRKFSDDATAQGLEMIARERAAGLLRAYKGKPQ